ncbi:MAG: ABC transporter substrate-binding protein, partial [Clostridiales bacterium]|nr:ABC transporter substrate-binding protein [Clostridiales bacterium]
MKKLLSILLATVLLLGTASAFAADDIAILVPNADHGWTGSVLTR